MPTIIYILIFTFFGCIVAIGGAGLILLKKTLSPKLTHALSAFAAGGLLGAAFLDLLPEAFHGLEALGKKDVEVTVFLYTLGGIILFFLLERLIHWFHHHQDDEHTDVKPLVPLILFGDGAHNFIDGVVIGATFLVDIRLGIITTLAIVLHELPQEVGDFGILLKEGMSRSKALLYNFLSQLTSVLGGVGTYFVGNMINGVLPYIIAITSGFFLYIALTDLVPDIHNENKRGFAFLETLLLILGILLIYLSVTFLHEH